MDTPKKAGRSKEARAKRTLSPAEVFFYENAGYSHDPKTETAEQGRIRCAKDLAKAEAEAERLEWSYEWPWDDSGCSGCDCGSDECDCSAGRSHETLGCVLKDADGNVLESLWGICNPSRSYARVVEAELASEALARIQQEQDAIAASVCYMNDSTQEAI